MADLWDRLPDETELAYRMFCLYRDMGADRTMDAIITLEKKKPTYLGVLRSWSQKFKWVLRANAYDDYLEKRLRKEREKDIIEMRDRHARIGRDMQSLASSSIQKAQDEYAQHGDVIPIAKVPMFAELGIKIERLAMGETTENIGGEVKVNDERGLGKKLILDKRAADSARELFERVTAGADEPCRISDGDESGEVDTSETS